MGRLGTHSKLNANPAFINGLHEEGLAQADAWLERNFAQLGVRSSFSPARLFG